MTKLRYAILFVLVFLMIGCATTSPPVVIKYIAILPPDSLLIDCPIVPPPEKSLYGISTLEEREGLLVLAGMNQYKEITKCRLNTTGLRKWKADQKIIYKDSKE